MPIDKIELTKEQVAKAMACKTAEELMAMAKAEGIELTKEEAEAYLAEMDDVELDSDRWRAVVCPIARTSLHLKRRLRVVPT